MPSSRVKRKTADTASDRSAIVFGKAHKLFGCTRPSCSKCLAKENDGEKPANLSDYIPSGLYMRSYKCKLCQESFNKMNLLRDHVQSHISDGPPYACTLCNTKCCTLTCAVRHLICHVEANH